MQNKAPTQAELLPSDYQNLKRPIFDIQKFNVNNQAITIKDGEDKFHAFGEVESWFEENWPIIQSALSLAAAPPTPNHAELDYPEGAIYNGHVYFNRLEHHGEVANLSEFYELKNCFSALIEYAEAARAYAAQSDGGKHE